MGICVHSDLFISENIVMCKTCIIILTVEQIPATANTDITYNNKNRLTTHVLK